MKKSLKPNDWKIFADLQANAYSLQKFQEKALSRFSKDFYRSEIQSQLKEKNEKKYGEVLEKQQAAFDMTNTLKQEEALKLSESQRTINEKKRYLNDCLQQLQSKISKTQESFSNNRETELNILRYHRLSEESAKALQSLRKTQRISSFQQYMKQKSLEDQKKAQDLEAEKIKDQELVNESIEMFNKCQVEYCEKMKNIEKKQKEYQKVYADVQKMNSWKARNKSELVRKWEADKDLENEAKQVIHFETKQKQKKAQNKAIKSQIEEKEEQKKREKLQKTQEKEYSDLTVLKEKLMKKQEKVNEAEFKNYYKRTLQYQIGEKEQEKFNENTLNEREKQMNRQIIEKYNNGEGIDFKGVPGLNKSQSALKNMLLREKLVGKFYSPQKVPGWENEEFSPNKREKSCEPSFFKDSLGEKHDPILNPIGSSRIINREKSNEPSFFYGSPDKRHDPILNPIGSSRKLNASFQRGKGLSSLFN